MSYFVSFLEWGIVLSRVRVYWNEMSQRDGQLYKDNICRG